MKQTRLGEFEEAILLLVGILDKEAYAFRTAEEFKNQTGRLVYIGAIHSTLNRLSEKGFLTSEMGNLLQNAVVEERESTPSRHMVIASYLKQKISKYRCGTNFLH